MKGKKATKEAFTELAPRYEETVDDELQTFWGWSYQGFVDNLIQQTPIKPGDKILDIATGTAVIPRHIMKRAENPEFRIFGLDITESMLAHGKQKIDPDHFGSVISLTCGDAMALPFDEDSFDVIITGLASHHIDIPLMLKEIKRVLKRGGTLSMIDVGASYLWRLPLVKGVLRMAAFMYFLLKENFSRAWAEAAAVTNVWTLEKWNRELLSLGFKDVKIRKIPSKNKWIPDPLAIYVSS